jgi:hypothetical protein
MTNLVIFEKVFLHLIDYHLHKIPRDYTGGKMIMRGVQEIYTQSLFKGSKVLWPEELFRDVKKIYAFDAEHVFEKDLFTNGFEPKENYVLILSPVEPSFIEGIYNRETGIALLNDNLISTERFPLAHIEDLDVGASSKPESSMTSYLQDKEISLIHSVKEKLTLARYYSDGIRNIHDSSLNTKIVKEIEDDLIHKIFHQNEGPHNKAIIDKAYFGTHAASGPIYMTHFYCDIDHCFILKGQGTSVASRILNQISSVAHKLGYYTFLYHCPFYPDELDCIVIPELKTVILDSEPPHEVEPLHPNETVMVLGEKCRHPETLFSHSLELRELEAKYKQLMRQAMMQLQDYRKYKRQEINQSNKYQNWTADKILAFLNHSI